MNSAENIQLVVCDMAGTTVKDEHEVERCFAKSAKQTNLQMTDDEILSVQGWAKKHVFEVFWERQLGCKNDKWLDNVENSYITFKKILEEYYINNPVYATDGCEELFLFLKNNNISIALTTGFYRKVTDVILEKLGWLEGLNDQRTGNENSIIQASIASDEVEHGRPFPDMIFKAMKLLNVKTAGNVINIGDTPSDIQSGLNAGCLYSFCVTNGTHNKEQLQKYSPDLDFASMNHFLEWLKGRFKR